MAMRSRPIAASERLELAGLAADDLSDVSLNQPQDFGVIDGLLDAGEGALADGALGEFPRFGRIVCDHDGRDAGRKPADRQVEVETTDGGQACFDEGQVAADALDEVECTL